MKVEGFESWKMGLEVLGSYLSHVHAKNVAYLFASESMGTCSHRPTWVPMQEGLVDWSGVYRALEAVGYDGWVSFEDFCDMRWQRKLTDNLAYLKGWESG